MATGNKHVVEGGGSANGGEAPETQSAFDLIYVYGALAYIPPGELQLAVASAVGQRTPLGGDLEDRPMESGHRTHRPLLRFSEELIVVAKSASNSGAREPRLWEAIGATARAQCFLLRPSDLVAILEAHRTAGHHPAPASAAAGQIIDALADRLSMSPLSALDTGGRDSGQHAF